jgi:hypothetical protein
MELAAFLPALSRLPGVAVAMVPNRTGYCLILDTTVLPKRGKTMKNLSLVCDNTQGKAVPGYEVLSLGLLTPRNFWPVDFDFRFSRTTPEGAREEPGASRPA